MFFPKLYYTLQILDLEKSIDRDQLTRRPADRDSQIPTVTRRSPDGRTTVKAKMRLMMEKEKKTLCLLLLNLIQQYRETSFIASDDIRQPI